MAAAAPDQRGALILAALSDSEQLAPLVVTCYKALMLFERRRRLSRQNRFKPPPRRTTRPVEEGKGLAVSDVGRTTAGTTRERRTMIEPRVLPEPEPSFSMALTTDMPSPMTSPKT